jgi:large subunit ribosomal protein L30
LLPSAANLSKKYWVKVINMAKTAAKTVKVMLVKGLIGTRETHRATVRGLGLRGINSISELEDTPAVRGMINKVSYLVKVVS